ncbi:MAG: exodeoxyribonuclease III [Erysipelotrichaceae bacterium]
MKLVSWNVNGIRACVNKGFYDFFNDINADIFCIQESKMQEGQLEFITPDYQIYMNSADKKGYSGTITFSKIKPLSVHYDMNEDEHAHEGRMITLEYNDFYLINVYTPNSKEGLIRLDYRMKWEDDFKTYVMQLECNKPVIICGDLNVAHQEIDIKNPKTNHKNPGFSDEERAKMTSLLNSGLIDSYRSFYPNQENAYSWWSYRFNARAKNVGWRIDYFLVSSVLKEQMRDAHIHSEILGSDHCPISLDLEVSM